MENGTDEEVKTSQKDEGQAELAKDKSAEEDGP